MTVRELIQAADEYALFVTIVLCAVPTAALALGWLHGPGRGVLRPWKYFYSVVIYLACVPGMLAAALTAYSVFFRNENLLDASLTVYVLPMLSMGATLAIVTPRVDLDAVPGFDRLSGLMGMLFFSFLAALLIQRTGVMLIFHGSFFAFLLVALGIFLALRWSAHAMLGRRPPGAEGPEG